MADNTTLVIAIAIYGYENADNATHSRRFEQFVNAIAISIVIQACGHGTCQTRRFTVANR